MNTLDDKREFYTVTEVSNFLGVTTATVRKWITSNLISGYTFGDRALRISKTDLNEFITNSRVKV